MMRLHYLQHVPFEGPAEIGRWAADRRYGVTGTRLFLGEPLPLVDSFDLLVVLGGPMNVDEHDRHPWLAEEKAFIERAIEHGRGVLAICLGAQLIARVLGATVRPNRHTTAIPSIMNAFHASCIFRDPCGGPRRRRSMH